MENKITKRDNFNTLLSLNEVKSNPTLVDFINHEIALLDKKNASRKTELTETQKENLQFKDDILTWLGDQADPKTTSAIAKAFGLSTQRVTPIMAKLLKENKVVVSTVKRVNYYTIA